MSQTGNGTSGLAGSLPNGAPRTEADAERLLTGKPLILDYKPSATHLILQEDATGRFPYPRMLYDVERMVDHPDVQLPYDHYKSGISAVKFTVKCRNTAEEQFAFAQLKRLWERDLERCQLAYDYGWAGLEVCYREKGSTLHYHSLEPAHPLDTWARLYRGRYVGFQVRGGLTTGYLMGSVGEYPGGRQRGTSDRDGPGVISLWGPGRWPSKGLWVVHRRRWDRYYGRSQLRGAWRPWLRLANRDGAEEVVDAGFYRCAYRGPVVRFPAEDFKRKDNSTDYDAARNAAREMAEQWKAGFSVALPNTRDSKGEYKWNLDDPESNFNPDPLLGYLEHLQQAICRGIGVPPELLEASEVGSGWSGRMIPLIAYHTAQRKNAKEIVRAFVEQVILPLLDWNFGPGSHCDIDTELVLPPGLAPEQPGGEQGGPGGIQPPGAQPGAQPGGEGADVGALADALAGGGGGEQAGVRIPYTGKRGGKGYKDASGRVHYEASTLSTAWEEEKHPRQHGRFAKKGSGRGKESIRWRTLKKLAGATYQGAQHYEHVASDFLAHGVDRHIAALAEKSPRAAMLARAGWWLAKLGTKALFATYTAGQVLAERVAKVNGATPEQAKKLRAVCTAIDVSLAKAVPLALPAAAAFIPVGSAAYLAYGGSVALLNQARRAVRFVKNPSGVTLATEASGDNEQALATVLERLRADPTGLWEACLFAALDQAKTLEEAIEIADRAASERSLSTLSEEEDPSLFELARINPEAWEPYVGKRGARQGQAGWKNRTTGRVSWNAHRPGTYHYYRVITERRIAARVPREQRASIDEAHRSVKHLLGAGGGKITGESIGEAVETLLSLNARDLHALKQRLGVSASGLKPDLARKIAERAQLANLQKWEEAQPKPPEKPKPMVIPKPRYDELGISPGDYEALQKWAKAEGEELTPGDEEAIAREARARAQREGRALQHVHVSGAFAEWLRRKKAPPPGLAREAGAAGGERGAEPSTPAPVDPAWARGHYRDWHHQLNSQEVRALSKYQSSKHTEAINGGLRASQGDPAALPEVERALVERMDKAIRKAPPLLEPATVFRGVGADALPAELDVGSTIPEYGYTSTSVDRQKAETYAHNAGKDSVLIEISLPAGFHAAYMDPIAEQELTTYGSGERELLLPRGTNYRITDVRDEGGQKIVRMEATPPPDLAEKAGAAGGEGV